MLRPDYSAQSSESLLQLYCASRDQAVFEVLYNRHNPDVRATVLRLGLRGADADDVAQSTWLRVHAHVWRDGDGAIKSFGGWLTAVARNQAKGHLAQGRRHAAQSGGAEIPVADPKDALDRAADLYEAIDRLGKEAKELLTDLIVNERPVTDLAAEAGVSRVTVYNWFNKSLESLRSELGS